MSRIIIFGNSGSGKSSLAKRLTDSSTLVHLDLDTVAWQRDNPTTRCLVEKSCRLIDEFIAAHEGWVIEGCYASLIEYAVSRASILYFLNLNVQDCIENCLNRPWEPHKYISKEAQDKNLEMLIDWIKDYYERDDDFSYVSHRRIFDGFTKMKVELTTNAQSKSLHPTDYQLGVNGEGEIKFT